LKDEMAAQGQFLPSAQGAVLEVTDRPPRVCKRTPKLDDGPRTIWRQSHLTMSFIAAILKRSG
jgi:hypothetical protein